MIEILTSVKLGVMFMNLILGAIAIFLIYGLGSLIISDIQGKFRR